MVDKCFSGCHNSFLINKDKIKEINKKNHVAYMINGEVYLVSTREIKKIVNKQYM